MKENLEEHIPLIYRVINQMGLQGDAAEEAFSEGLVAITEANISYNPDFNVPLANWLAQNTRWRIQAWIAKQRRDTSMRVVSAINEQVIYNIAESNEQSNVGQSFAEYTEGLRKPEEVENIAFFNEVIAKMGELLTERERQVLMAEAYGFTGKRVAQVLGVSEVQVTKIKHRAQKKLRKVFNG